MSSPAWRQEPPDGEGGGHGPTEQRPCEAGAGAGPPEQGTGLCPVLCRGPAEGLRSPGPQGVQAADIAGLCLHGNG